MDFSPYECEFRRCTWTEIEYIDTWDYRLRFRFMRGGSGLIWQRPAMPSRRGGTSRSDKDQPDRRSWYCGDPGTKSQKNRQRHQAAL
jgi:hypothetical protein